jgi:uncharacterized protein YcsI (UPF0317 family)
MDSVRFDTAQQVRHACRTGRFTAPTSGLAQGFQQGNVVILPAAYADDFLRFLPQLSFCASWLESPDTLAVELVVDIAARVAHAQSLKSAAA